MNLQTFAKSRTVAFGCGPRACSHWSADINAALEQLAVNAVLPKPGFSRFMRWISARISRDAAAPAAYCAGLSRAEHLKCVPMPANKGVRLTRTYAERHSIHTGESPIQNRRSELFHLRRYFAERCRTPN
jgi:hypothetical protein